MDKKTVLIKPEFKNKTTNEIFQGIIATTTNAITRPNGNLLESFLQELEQKEPNINDFLVQVQNNNVNPINYISGKIYIVEGNVNTSEGHPVNAENTKLLYIVLGDTNKKIFCLTDSDDIYYISQLKDLSWGNWKRFFTLEEFIDEIGKYIKYIDGISNVGILTESDLTNHNVFTTNKKSFYGVGHGLASIAPNHDNDWYEYLSLGGEYTGSNKSVSLAFPINGISGLFVRNTSDNKWRECFMTQLHSNVTETSLTSDYPNGINILDGTEIYCTDGTPDKNNPTQRLTLINVEKNHNTGFQLASTSNSSFLYFRHMKRNSLSEYEDWRPLATQDLIENIVNENILINADFRSDYFVDLYPWSGNHEYSHTTDRESASTIRIKYIGGVWCIKDAVAKFSDKGLNLRRSNDNATYYYFIQTIENGYKLYKDKNFTITIGIDSNGTEYNITGTGYCPIRNIDSPDTVEIIRINRGAMTITLRVNIKNEMYFYIISSASMASNDYIKYIKLELGKISTSHVPDKNKEWLRVQRYEYVLYNTLSSAWYPQRIFFDPIGSPSQCYFFIELPVPMRVSPTISFDESNTYVWDGRTQSEVIGSDVSIEDVQDDKIIKLKIILNLKTNLTEGATSALLIHNNEGLMASFNAHLILQNLV